MKPQCTQTSQVSQQCNQEPQNLQSIYLPPYIT